MYGHQNDIVTEAYMDFYLAQPASDRMAYKHALESDTNPAGKARLVAKLYEECIRPNDVDYGAIPDSRGNLLKVKGYDTTSQAIGLLNQLFAEDPTNKELKLLNDFNDMLISCRADFEYGYKYNIEILKILYCNMVRCLFELVDMAIASYANYLTNKKENNPKIKPMRITDSLVVKSAKGFIQMHKSGQWKTMMSMFKSPKVASLGESLIFMEVQAMAYPDPVLENIQPEEKRLDLYQKALENSSDNSILKASAQIGNIFKSRGMNAVKMLGILVLMMWILRNLIRWFMRKAGKVSGYFQNQLELLKGAIEIQKETKGSSEKQISNQEKWYNRIQSLKGFIDAHILKADELAKKDIQEDNRKNFTKEEIVPQDEDGFVFM